MPGVHSTGAYLVRGSGHNQYGGYTERSDEYLEVVDRLRKKFLTASGIVPKPVIDVYDQPTGAIISIGSCDGAVREARDRLAINGIMLDYMRVRAFPFCESVTKFLKSYDQVFVVEQNRDGQLRALLLIETGVASEKLTSILYYGGEPMSCQDILGSIQAYTGEEKAA